MKPQNAIETISSRLSQALEHQDSGRQIEEETGNLPSGQPNKSPVINARRSSLSQAATQQSSSPVLTTEVTKNAETPSEPASMIFKLSPFNLLAFNNKVASHAPSNQISLREQQCSQPAIQLGPMIPISSRKVRDSGSLFLFLAYISFLVYMIWDGIMVKENDIDLVVHGHDNYGNICGRNNKHIRFVEKSGQNYTQKPYTKYTLINSHFERYTLDTGSLRDGELLYVKDVEVNSALRRQEKEKLVKSHSLGMNGYEGSNRLTVANGAMSETDFYQLIARNQTHLNRVKTNQMYQYPPMHDYMDGIEDLAQERVGGVVTGSGSRSKHKPVARSPEVLFSGPSNSNYPKAEHRNTTSNLDQLSSAQKPYASTPSYFNSMTPKLAQQGASLSPPDLSFAPSNERRTSVSANGASLSPVSDQTPPPIIFISSSTQRPSKPTTSLSLGFHSHESGNGVSPNFEHVLINRNHSSGSSRSPGSNFPDVVRYNEVSTQLLYLSECVDFCPDDHVELLFFRCMPKNWRFSLFPNAINVTRTFIDDIITDVSHCYRELIYTSSFALFLSVSLLIFLRFLASFIIWACLIVAISLLVSMASYAWMSYYYMIIDLNNLMPQETAYSERLASSDKWLMGSIFLTFIALASIGTVIFMRKRILLVTKLFRESGKAIADMPLLLLQPVLTLICLIFIVSVWSFGLVCLQAIKIPAVDRSTGFVVFKTEFIYKIMKWYHLFAFLWMFHFAIACQHYVIGASVSKWYFSANRYNLHSPIGSSVSELILYYLGSVALGSFLVAIFKVLLIIVRQIQSLLQRSCVAPPQGADGNGTSGMGSLAHVGGSSSCCGTFSYVWRSFIWFFDKIVMIINRDAYVEIAIHGFSFITASQRAFRILASNPLRLLAIKSVSNALLLVAKVCVVFGTISMSLILVEEKSSQLNYYWSPIIISAIFAYVVANWFLSVYEMVIDALFICYCEDYERSKNQELAHQLAGNNLISQILSNQPQVYLRS